jgi:hypothetical protein
LDVGRIARREFGDDTENAAMPSGGPNRRVEGDGAHAVAGDPLLRVTDAIAYVRGRPDCKGSDHNEKGAP